MQKQKEPAAQAAGAPQPALRCPAAEAAAPRCPIFPGIEILYDDVHAQKCPVRQSSDGNILEITHCCEGRIERAFREEFCYLSPGDLSIALDADLGGDAYFPLAHYRGIRIRINLDRAPRCLSCFLDDVEVSPQALARKFCSGSSCFIARSNESIAHIFSELYNVPDSIRKGYFKVKILELLLFLSAMPVETAETRQHIVSRAQVALAKAVCTYLTAHMDSRIPLEQLSAHFHVSGTQIKTSFRLVYGVSLYAYMRRQKMESAALMLRDTERSVLEIAGCFGYDNGSKFSKAFKDILGVPPAAYRHRARTGEPLPAPPSPENAAG